MDHGTLPLAQCGGQGNPEDTTERPPAPAPACHAANPGVLPAPQSRTTGRHSHPRGQSQAPALTRHPIAASKPDDRGTHRLRSLSAPCFGLLSTPQSPSKAPSKREHDEPGWKLADKDWWSDTKHALFEANVSGRVQCKMVDKRSYPIDSHTTLHQNEKAPCHVWSSIVAV